MGADATRKEKLKQILEGGGLLSSEKMQDYIDFKLSEEEQHQIERMMLSSSFAAEAMEGYEEADSPIDIKAHTRELHRAIKKYNKERGFGVDYSVWHVAASVVLLFVVTIGIWTVAKDGAEKAMSSSNNMGNLAQQAEIPSEGSATAPSWGEDQNLVEEKVQENASETRLERNKSSEPSPIVEAEAKKSSVDKADRKVVASPKEVKSRERPASQNYSTSDVWVEREEVVAARPSASLSEDINQEVRLREVFDQAKQAYENKKFAEAIPLFERFLKAEQKSEHSKNYEESEWLLANAYLKVGKTTAANKLFTQIAKSESSYAAKARQVLN